MKRKVEAGCRVLLVESDAPFRRSLETFLRRAGYAYDSCSLAAEAFNLAKRNSYSCVIVEYHLPDENGIRFIKRVRRIQPEAAVVLLSVYDSEMLDSHLLADSAIGLLNKPFDPVQLEMMLQSLASAEKVPRRKLKWERMLRISDVLAPV